MNPLEWNDVNFGIFLLILLMYTLGIGDRRRAGCSERRFGCEVVCFRGNSVEECRMEMCWRFVILE